MLDFITPYNHLWQTEFEKLKSVLEAALNGIDIDIQHVGSTAVASLYAKPVLDIDIIIDDKTILAEVSSKLEKIAYLNKGEQGIAGRFAFRQSSAFTPITNTQENWLSHHLYVCFSDSLALKNHLRFRDALRKDPNLVENYSNLKLALIKQQGMTREAYTKQKTAFIISVLTTLGLEDNELQTIKNANA